MLIFTKKLKSVSQKGALFIEYALIFALVLVVGTYFTLDSGLGNNITSVFTKTSNVLSGGEKSNPASEKLKQYAAALTSSIMDHSASTTTSNGRDLPLGKELASGAHEPNFGDQLRAAGIDSAYVYQGMSTAYGKLSDAEKQAFRDEHYLGNNGSYCSLILSTDGNTTWENGQSYNAVQYMTYKGKNANNKDTQIVGSYRNIVVNVDDKGKKTYTDTAGNSIQISSAANDGGGWQKFAGQ